MHLLHSFICFPHLLSAFALHSTEKITSDNNGSVAHFRRGKKDFMKGECYLLGWNTDSGRNTHLFKHNIIYILMMACSWQSSAAQCGENVIFAKATPRKVEVSV